MTGSSSKLLQIQGTWYQERKQKEIKPEAWGQKNYSTAILNHRTRHMTQRRHDTKDKCGSDSESAQMLLINKHFYFQGDQH
jgi:hypothetical protein